MHRPLRPVILALILIPFLSPVLLAQKPGTENIVPNPGFELFSDYPSTWYYSGRDFSRVALYWTSPTAASPDLYAPGVIIPKSWVAKGFGAIKPHEGKSHAGITVYGCEGGKPHCREYIQIHLTEPLVPGQRYGFSCMLSHLQKTVSIKNIGLWFSEYEWDEPTHDPIEREPVLILDRFIPSDGKWYRWTGHFVAGKATPFLLIGNFGTDDRTHFRLPSRSEIRYGYYYIDDVRLFKIPPILDAPVMESPLDDFIPKAGEIVTLSRIFFEHDRTDFLPRALIQLQQLHSFLKKYPKMRIEIIGHTDITGTDAYNLDLSVRRSKAVVHWLVDKGIPPGRLDYSGYGCTQPISTNETSQGRSMNRRVEIKVISL